MSAQWSSNFKAFIIPTSQREYRIKNRKQKGSCQIAEIHCKDWECNRWPGRDIEFCSNQSHAKASFSQTETSFDFDTIRVIMMCIFLFFRCRIPFRTPQSFSWYPDVLAFAVSPVFLIPIDLIDKHPLRIVSHRSQHPRCPRKKSHSYHVQCHLTHLY